MGRKGTVKKKKKIKKLAVFVYIKSCNILSALDTLSSCSMVVLRCGS